MLLYLHGFNSSPASHKAQVLKSYLEARGRAAEYACPALPDTPAEAVRAIERAISGCDPSRLALTTRVNGAVMQQATTDLLLNDVPTLVEYLSTFTELHPGDVIATGTPGGVGAARTPPLWLQAGDVVEVDITGIGVLRNEVVDEGGPT